MRRNPNKQGRCHQRITGENISRKSLSGLTRRSLSQSRRDPDLPEAARVCHFGGSSRRPRAQPAVLAAEASGGSTTRRCLDGPISNPTRSAGRGETGLIRRAAESRALTTGRRFLYRLIHPTLRPASAGRRAEPDSSSRPCPASPHRTRRRRPSPRPRPKPPAAGDAKRAPTLANLRAEIDRIDKELVDLLNRRSEVAVQIGQIKQAQGLDIWSSSREDEVVARALEASRGPLPHETLRLIFRELMSSSRSLQRQLRVACLGPEVQLQPPGLGRQVRRVGRARPGRLDRRGLRGGEPPARPVRDRPAGELDRRPDRRHARHVRPAPRPEDPRRGPAPGPPLPAGQGGMGRRPPGLLQGPGDLAVPELAGEEPPAGRDGRRRLLGRGRRDRPAATRRPPPSPASPPPTPTA